MILLHAGIGRAKKIGDMRFTKETEMFKTVDVLSDDGCRFF